jgi:hypothetical protein
MPEFQGVSSRKTERRSLARASVRPDYTGRSGAQITPNSGEHVMAHANIGRKEPMSAAYVVFPTYNRIRLWF